MFTLLKVWWLQARYGLESGADVSRGLGGAVGSAKIRGVAWENSKHVAGHFGKSVAEARLNALNFWIRKHAALQIGRNATHAFTNISKDGVTHTFFFGQTRYGAGQEPVGRHRPDTIVEIENGQNSLPCDTRCDSHQIQAACESCRTYK